MATIPLKDIIHIRKSRLDRIALDSVDVEAVKISIDIAPCIGRYQKVIPRIGIAQVNDGISANPYSASSKILSGGDGQRISTGYAQGSTNNRKILQLIARVGIVILHRVR